MAKTKITHFIDLLSIEDITKLYKHFAGVTQVKFKDRSDAEIRLLTISFGKLRPTMLEAFRQVGLAEEIALQFGELLRGPILLPHGTMKPEDMRKHAKALAADKPNGSKTGNVKPLKSTALAVLWALKEMIPLDAKEDVASVSSKDVADKLSTSPKAVCAAADDLVKRNFIAVEDDSVDEQNPFFWLSLLPAGRDLPVHAPGEKQVPGPRSGPNSGFSGKFIYRLVTANPRREGTHGWNSFNLVKDGMSYEEYKNAGGRNNDLQWDVDKKFVELRTERGGASAVAVTAPSKVVEMKKEKTAAPKKEKAASTVKKTAPVKKARAASGGGGKR